MDYPRGAEWRKWDLHFHTPSSFDYRKKSLTADDLVARLRADGISLVAITDHHLIDSKMIQEIRNSAGEDITVLPGIELRTELGGSKSVHLIGIFKEDINIDILWRNLSVKLKITEEDVAERTDEKVFVRFEDAAKIIKNDFGGVVSIHAGDKTNSIEQLKSVFKHFQEFKAELLRDVVDILEIKDKEDYDFYTNIAFPQIDVTRPLVYCSDSHDASEESLRQPCWVKADPNFNGLLQAINEPKRCHLGEVPPHLQSVRARRHFYINKVSVKPVDKDEKKSVHFNYELPVNSGLVVAIGKKGSGKSAFLDTIGVASSGGNYEDYSFLNGKKFCRKPNSPASLYECSVAWMDGTVVDNVNLDKKPSYDDVSRVKYIPQSSLETMCNEINGQGKKLKFIRELENVIFSHIDETDRLGQSSFDNLISLKTIEFHKEIESIKSSLHDLNVTISMSEGDVSSKNESKTQNSLDDLLQKYKNQVKGRPKKVKNPSEKKEMSQEEKERGERLSSISTLLKKIDNKKSELKKTIGVLKNQKHVLSSSIERIKSLVRAVSEESSRINKDLKSNGIDISLNIDVTLNEKELTNHKEYISKKIERFNKVSYTHGTLEKVKNTFEREQKELQSELSLEYQKYQLYMKELNDWKKTLNELKGDASKEGTIACLLHNKKEAQKKLRELPKLYNQRVELIKKIFSHKQSILDVYRDMYSPAQGVVKSFVTSTNFSVPVTLGAELKINNFTNNFHALINKVRSGPFQGVEEGSVFLSELIQENDFSTSEGVGVFFAAVDGHLASGCTPSERYAHLSKQLSKDITPTELYDYLSGLDYLAPEFSLYWDGKPVSQLSPGERGILLLFFYLVIDSDPRPLVIDQPEDNLDNETIFNVLVPCIECAKDRRQVIVVTHNPNIAVVCDAEQVIFSSYSHSNIPEFTYESGSIESGLINKRVVDTLEGTMPAFIKRDKTYKVCK